MVRSHFVLFAKSVIKKKRKTMLLSDGNFFLKNQIKDIRRFHIKTLSTSGVSFILVEWYS